VETDSKKVPRGKAENNYIGWNTESTWV